MGSSGLKWAQLGSTRLIWAQLGSTELNWAQVLVQFEISIKFKSSEWPWNGQEVQEQPWGLQEPSGEDCAVADSALQWQWNSVRCVISAHLVCEALVLKCASPEVNSGSYIETSMF